MIVPGNILAIVLLLLAGGSMVSAQVESRSSFTTAGNDSAAGPYQVHATMGTAAGGRHAGGSVYEAAVGWKASIHNPPMVAGGDASLGTSSNGSYTISYAQLQQATGAKDPDGDPVSFLVSATGGGLKVEGADVASLRLGEGKSFVWTPAVAGRLSVVAFDGVLASPEVGFTAGVVAPVFTQQPSDITVEKGIQALLSTSVAGTGPLTYQWFKDGQQVALATNLAFFASSATRAIQGRYELEVVGPGGTNRSQSAFLKVVSAQRISSVGFGFGGDVLVRFGDADGDALSTADRRNFTIQISTNLNRWVTVSTNGSSVSFSGGSLVYSHALEPGSQKSFFRILE